ncbi:hypothetical protein [Zavarzinia compransoris]|uniref:Uncharacterized protein n=1 Tax=Zavarzinia compransoris TaxID=1264899 RepID=A0A317EF44_9PROT|nr:hypothetical protein [Zavarzinia compransoris]PWR24003.1 hypothetical protein DKG75_05530 [Zavarzinia compransoris]TDP48263.1 hypothetical protein DES42_102566 [Zavarzinia compransoris]
MILGRFLAAIPLLIAGASLFIAWVWLHALAPAPASSFLAGPAPAEILAIEIVERRVKGSLHTIDLAVTVRLADGRSGIVGGYQRIDGAGAVADVLADQVEDGALRVRAFAGTIYRHDPDLFMLAGGTAIGLIGLFMLPLGLAVVGLAGAGFIRAYAGVIAAVLVVLGGAVGWSGLNQGAVRPLDRLLGERMTAEVVASTWHRLPVTGAAPAGKAVLLPAVLVRLPDGRGEVALQGLPGAVAIPGLDEPAPAVAPGDRVEVTSRASEPGRVRLAGWRFRPLATAGLGAVLLVLGLGIGRRLAGRPVRRGGG